jgi:SSS family solute:Na+ symporter
LIHSFATLNFAHFAIFNFLACSIVCVAASLSAPAPELESIRGLTFGSLTDEQKASARDSYGIVDIVLSVSLVVIVICILSYFTG